MAREESVCVGVERVLGKSLGGHEEGACERFSFPFAFSYGSVKASRRLAAYDGPQVGMQHRMAYLVCQRQAPVCAPGTHFRR